VILYKKAVATEMLLTIGVLIAVGIAMIQIKSVFYGEQDISKEEVVNQFARDIDSIIDKCSSTTGDTFFTYEPSIKKYKLEVKDNVITIQDKLTNKTVMFAKVNVNLKNTIVIDSKIIYISKVESDVYITGRCLEIGEECSSSFVCCDKKPCWGDTTFICQEQCADNGIKASDDESCCSGFLNETTGLCDELPYCPSDRICPGAPESKEIAGEDCCVGDTPICTNGHCCPVDKPKWCSNPEDGEKRCMDNDEFKEKCGSGEVLIVALKSNLKSVYSDSQINNLESKINEFIDSLNNDGLDGMFLYLDEDETSDIVAIKVTSPNSWSNIDGVLDQLVKKLDIKYIIIIGGYNRFPQAFLGTSDSRDQKKTWSDDIYGDYNGDYIIDIPVGRIPDPNNGDLDVILNALNTYINLHNSGGLDLSTYKASIMGCGGPDTRNWITGKCFCSAIWGTTCSACGDCCGCISAHPLSGNKFVCILAHGPGTASYDKFSGGCLNEGTGFLNSIDVSNAVWMSMSCGGGHLTYKSSTSGSMTMTFLKNGGAVYIGSTNNNYGIGGSGCPVPGGDLCIGSLYTEIAMKFDTGKRIGDSYKEGKINYINYPSKYGRGCGAGHRYQYIINVFYGDPTLNIKRMW